jgi:hypothetical protein
VKCVRIISDHAILARGPLTMSKLLDRAVAEIRRLPEDRQDEAAAILLDFAAQEPGANHLSPEQISDLEDRLASAPDYATDEEVEALFRRLRA